MIDITDDSRPGRLAIAGQCHPCTNGYCTADAVFYVSGPTLGRSPRILLVGGERARELLAGPLGAGAGLCADCASLLVEGAAGAPIPLAGPEEHQP